MNRTQTVLLVVVVVLALGITTGLLLHFFVFDDDDGDGTAASSSVLVDCHPDANPTQEACETRGCTWAESEVTNAPWCTFPAETGYTLKSLDNSNPDEGWSAELERIDTPSLFGDDYEELVVDVEYYTESMLRIKIRDPSETRYQIPAEAVNIERPSTTPDSDTRLYDVSYVEGSQFGIKVTRRDSGTVIFDTSVPGMTFSDQYLQITTRLASSNIYGFGEHVHKSYKHDMNWKKWTMFTRDYGVDDSERHLYGHQTLYMNIEDGEHTNAVYFHNSNAMDVVLQPDPNPAITYHTIGGILDFYIFLGPSPENIVQQYTQALGRPTMVPYWSLGFQLSRWDYNNITHVRNVVQRNINASIPFDVQYGDVDIMENKYLFTYDKDKYSGLPEFVDELHAQNIKYIVIQDHCVGSDQTIIDTQLNGTYYPLSAGKTSDIFIRDPRNTSTYLEGEVWPGLVYYPDFTKVDEATDWWFEQCEYFYYNDTWQIEYDALWIDMNEPSNFIPGSTTGCDDSSKYNNPPFLPNVVDDLLYSKTICMESEQNWGLHYDVHSLYGHSMSIVSYNTLRRQFPEKRPFVLTRSQFAGSQKYAVHWLGDNQSLWSHLKYSIIGMMEYSLFGFAYTGSDICGFWLETNEELCQRWHLLGAFYPYARNHNGELWPDQDPGSPLFSDELRNVTRAIINTRYQLLPYLYTLIHEAHAYGNTVVRPVLHEFLSDESTWEIDTQFLWGAALMITPALEQGQETVNIYVPNDRWYDFYTGSEVTSVGQSLTLDIPMDYIYLHVRGGYIIPWQLPAVNTVESRKNDMGLIVAMGASPDYKAEGSLFWDDGETYNTFEEGKYLQVDFSFALDSSNYQLLLSPVNYDIEAQADGLIFNTIYIYGLDEEPSSVTINGTLEFTEFSYDSTKKVLTMEDLGLEITNEHSLEWS